MSNQGFFAKVMLGSLAMAAILGVAGVLFAKMDVVWRVTGTALLTSVSAALLWQAAVRLEQNRTAMKVAQAGVVLFYVFALGGIWDFGHAERCWLTAVICLSTLSVAAGGWSLRHQPDYRHAGLLATVAAVLSGICWLFGVWVGDSFDLTFRFPFIGFAVAGWSAGAAVCLIGVGTVPVRPWRWIGVVATVVGFLLSIYAIYHEWTESISDWIFVAASVVVVVMHAVLCIAIRSAPARLPVRTIAIIATIATAVFCDLIMLLEFGRNDLLVRLATASGIVASASTIATAFIIQRHAKHLRTVGTVGTVAADGAAGLGAMAGQETSSSGGIPSTIYRSVTLACPACHQQIDVPTGRSVCPNCKLAFNLEIGI